MTPTTGMRSRLGDGTPGFELYLDEAAFVWSGDTEDPIEVSFFSYTEPVSHLIHISARSDFTKPHPLTTHAALFQRVCAQWITWILAGQTETAAARITGGETEQDDVSAASLAHYAATGLYLLRPRTTRPAPLQEPRQALRHELGHELGRGSRPLLRGLRGLLQREAVGS